MEAALIAHGLATEASLDPFRPGGSENPSPDPIHDADAWLRFYRRLNRRHAFLEFRRESAGASAAEEAAVFAAFSARPMRLPRPAPTDEPIDIYPKGPGAMWEIEARAEYADTLALAAEVLRKDATTSPVAAEQRIHVLREMAYQQAMCLWIATHPTAGLPYGFDTVRPDPPQRWRDTNAVDYLLAMQYHHIVNDARVGAAHALSLPPAKSPSDQQRPSWGGVWGFAAHELGLRPRDLVWDWTMPEILDVLRLAGDQQARALREAEREAQTKPKVVEVRG
jgi:hypothetical protein